MQTVLTSNGSRTTLLLVDENEVVLSGWLVDDALMRQYIHAGGMPDIWHAGKWDFGFDPEADRETDAASPSRSISDYGREVGRNGIITDPQERTFWEREMGVSGLPGHASQDEEDSRSAALDR